MKRFFISILLVLSSLLVFSQNNGQSNYNDLIRIDYFGYTGGAHVFRVKNLQPCMGQTNYTIWGSGQINTMDLFPYGESFFSHIAPQSTIVNARAKAILVCGVSAPDRGWVETSSSSSVVLSTTISDIRVRRIGLSQIELIFTANETTSTMYHLIKISEDGTNFKILKILTPSGLVQNKTYKIIFNH